jgi:hypothetical protein
LDIPSKSYLKKIFDPFCIMYLIPDDDGHIDTGEVLFFKYKVIFDNEEDRIGYFDRTLDYTNEYPGADARGCGGGITENGFLSASLNLLALAGACLFLVLTQ